MTAFGDPTTGPLIAAAVNAALAGNQYKDMDGTTLVDPLLLAGARERGYEV